MPTRPARPGGCLLVGVLVTGIVVVIIAAIIGAAVVVAQQRGTAGQVRPVRSSPEPTKQPTKRPSPTKQSTPPDKKPTQPTKKPTKQPSKKPAKPTTPEGILKRNLLYTERMPRSNCRQPPTPAPTTRKGYERYFGTLIDCLEDVYAADVKRAGYTLTEPELLIYKNRVQTPCGESPEGYAVFYCPANETIYATVDALQGYSWMRLGAYWVIYHEYAHHVQNRVRVLEASYVRDTEEGYLQTSRRVELQADCWMGMTSRTMTSARLSEADRSQMRYWRNQVPDDIHGSSKAQLRWVFRGFGSTRYSTCNTWTAKAKDTR